ncbi:MAG: TadE family protein [Bdellovibrio sp.]
MLKLLSKKGQTLIEAAIVLPLLIAIVTGLALVIYRGMVYYFADYHLHEALLCTENNSVLICQNELNQRLKPALLKGIKANVSLNKNHISTTGRVSIDLNPPMLLEKKLSKGFPKK